MPTYNSTYLVSALGFSGRVPFSSVLVGYFLPLLDSALVSIDNSVSGSSGVDYNPPTNVKFPLLFQFTTTAACRVRQRAIHPSVTEFNDTAALFTRLIASCGYSDVAAGTDAIRNMTLPAANIAAGTTNNAFRAFNVIRSGSYGGLVPAGVTFPVVVNSFRDCWLQIIARDGAGTGTTGELVFQCVSDSTIVGY